LSTLLVTNEHEKEGYWLECISGGIEFEEVFGATKMV
jgi:hypothetical protein